MWIELHQTLPRHPKTIRLALKLGVTRAEAVGHLVCLWLWAMDYASDGDLSDLAAEEIAAAAEWTGDADRFVEQLRACGWIDEPGKIHDWLDYYGRMFALRQKNAARMRLKRAENVQRTTGARSPNVQGLPDRTGPDLNQTEEKDAHADDSTPEVAISAPPNAISPPPNGEPDQNQTAKPVNGSGCDLHPPSAVFTQADKKNAPAGIVEPALANLVETRIPVSEPVGSALPKIQALHAVWQELTGQPAVRLDQAAERRWFEFIRAGWGEPELRRVVDSIQRGITRRERNRGALRLSNLIDPTQFNEELGMATSTGPKPKPRAPEPEKPPVKVATPEELARWAAQMKADREKLTGAIRVNGESSPTPDAIMPSPEPTLPPDVLAAVQAAQERNRGKTVTV